MSDKPLQPDHHLATATAARAITSCFPAINTTSLRHLGSGWEFDAFLTADNWAFRFPRHAESADLFSAEGSVHRLVKTALPSHISIPIVELMGNPTPEFPHAFAGHRYIEGIAADSVNFHLLPTVALEIAHALGALHSIPEHEVRAAGISGAHANDKECEAWLQNGMKTAGTLRGLDPAVDRAITWLSSASFPSPAHQDQLQLIHQDLSPEHVLVDPATGTVTGILDWTDAILGDPARDFVFLVTWRGWPFTEQVLQNYPRVVDQSFRTRLRFMSQLLSTMWLAHAHERGEDLTKLIQGVHHAFASKRSAD